MITLIVNDGIYFGSIYKGRAIPVAWRDYIVRYVDPERDKCLEDLRKHVVLPVKKVTLYIKDLK